MKILVINTGSSSLKFTCLDMADQSVLPGDWWSASAGRTRLRYRDHLGPPGGTRGRGGRHTGAVRLAVARLTRPGRGVLASAAEIAAVGHRLAPPARRSPAASSSTRR